MLAPSLHSLPIPSWFNDFSFTGECGIVYRGYLNTRGGNKLVAIKTGKRKF